MIVIDLLLLSVEQTLELLSSIYLHHILDFSSRSYGFDDYHSKI